MWLCTVFNLGGTAPFEQLYTLQVKLHIVCVEYYAKAKSAWMVKSRNWVRNDFFLQRLPVIPGGHQDQGCNKTACDQH